LQFSKLKKHGDAVMFKALILSAMTIAAFTSFNSDTANAKGRMCSTCFHTQEAKKAEAAQKAPATKPAPVKKKK
jgi:hypothetical protein